jgi:predicted component of viral defense system (DUF524 family)
MTQNQFKRYRVIVKKEDAEYFEQLAKARGITTTSLLKIILADVSQKRISIQYDDKK